MSIVTHECQDLSWYREGINGWSGHREFDGMWQDRLSDTPQIGDLFPGTTGLYCIDREFRGSGPSQPGVADPATGRDCDYSYAHTVCDYAEMPRIESELVWRFSGAMELLETARGRTWRSDGSISDMSQAIPYSAISAACTKVLASNPMSLCMNCVNKLNVFTWRPSPTSPMFPKYTLLFLNPEIEEWYDYERTRLLGKTVYLYRVTYNFIWRPMNQNRVWRTGELGAGWDEFVEPLYEFADFNPMLGLPPGRGLF